MFPGFSFSWLLWYFSGLQPAGLQRGGEALNRGSENATSGIFREFPAFSGFEMSGLKILLTTIPVEPGFRSAGSYKSRLWITNTWLVAKFCWMDTGWQVW